MIKEALLGLELLNSFIPIPVNESRILVQKNIPEIWSSFTKDVYIPKPIRIESRTFIKNNEEKIKLPQYFFINNFSNMFHNLEISKYNSTINSDITDYNTGGFERLKAKERGIFLFPKILGKKFLEIEYSNPIEKEEYTKIIEEQEDYGYYEEYTKYTWVKKFSVPITKEVVNLSGSSLFAPAKDQAKYYYYNDSILNNNSDNKLRKYFLKENKNKKFLVKRLIIKPKLEIVNRGYSKTNLILSGIYLNGHRLDSSSEKFVRSLNYIEADYDFELNKNDIVTKQEIFRQARKTTNASNLKLGDELVQKEQRDKLVNYGFKFTGFVVSFIPSISKISSIANLLVEVFMDKNDNTIYSTSKIQELNGDNINVFSFELKHKIAFNWGDKPQLIINDVILDGIRQHWDFTDVVKIKLDDLVIEFDGEWVSENYETLQNSSYINLNNEWNYLISSKKFEPNVWKNSITGEESIVKPSGVFSHYDDRDEQEERY